MGWGWRKKGGRHSGLGICSSLFLHLDIPHPDQPPPTYYHPPSGRVSNRRYRLVSSLMGRGAGESQGEEEEEAGLKEGVGESGLGQVLATTWLAPVR